MNCETPNCGHQMYLHLGWDGVAGTGGKCRVTGCDCREWTHGIEALEPGKVVRFQVELAPGQRATVNIMVEDVNGSAE